jgi:hypothetical protein
MESFWLILGILNAPIYYYIGVKLERYRITKSFNKKDKLTIEELAYLREAMYGLDSVSAFRAKRFFADRNNIKKVTDKLYQLM